MNENVVIPELWKKAFERAHVYKDEEERKICESYSSRALPGQVGEFYEFFASEAGAALRQFMRESGWLQLVVWKGEDGHRGYLRVDGFWVDWNRKIRSIDVFQAVQEVRESGLMKEGDTFLEYFKKEISIHLQCWLGHVSK